MEVIWQVREERRQNERIIVKQILEREGLLSKEMMTEEYINESVFSLISKLGMFIRG